jgi:hypothetical protein
MNRIISGVVFALLTSTVLTAIAQDSWLYGAGARTSCGSWVTEHQATENALGLSQTHWVLGFLSGVGWTGTKLRETDSDAVRQWMTLYCQQHPLEQIHDATKKLIAALQP